jgi:hypothetical protein
MLVAAPTEVPLFNSKEKLGGLTFTQTYAAGNRSSVSLAGHPYQPLYVPVEAPPFEKLTVQVGEKEEKQTFPKARMADPDTLQALQVRELYSLVEIEINGGKGSPEGAVELVGTKIRVLDGTKEYPIKTADAVREATKKYEAFLREKTADIDAALGKAREDAVKEAKGRWAPSGAEPANAKNTVYVTWMPASETLEVRFVTRIVDGRFGPQVERAGNLALRRPGLEWGLELGRSYAYSKAGTPGKELTLEIRRHWAAD